MRVFDESEQLTPNEVINNNKVQQLTVNNREITLDKKLLPSNGAFYEADIKITPFSGMDLKNITRVQEGTSNQVILNILSKRISGIDIGQILTNDKLWFIYYIRDITYHGAPVKMKCNCPHCSKQSIQQYTIDKLNVIHYNGKLPDSQVKLPNGDLVEFKFPTISSEQQIQRLKNDPNNFEAVDDEFALLASYIKTVNGKHVNLFRAYEMMSTIDAESFCYIVHKLDEFAFVCDRTAQFICPECGETFNEFVPFTQEFFIPKLY